MSYLTGTSTELIYANPTAGTAKASFTTEIAINDQAGMGLRAHIPPDFWRNANDGIGRGIWVRALGILSTTVTPTYTFSLRLGVLDSITSVIALGSAALTSTSGGTCERPDPLRPRPGPVGAWPQSSASPGLRPGLRPGPVPPGHAGRASACVRVERACPTRG